MTFRPLSEAFIRRSRHSVLPVLDTTGRRRVKKAVVCVARLVAAFIMVHGLLSFLSDVYGLFDPSGKTLWLSVDHRRLRPVDMVLLNCVVGESGLFCVKLDAQRILMKVHPVLDFTSVLCSCNLTPNFLPVSPFQWPDLQAEIWHSHGQPCFSTSGQHVHGAFRTETPRHNSRRF